MSYVGRADAALAALEARGLRRSIREHDGSLIDFSSNDYLGLACDERVVAAMRSAQRAGSGGARLLAGAHPEHRALEAALAELTGRNAALLFSSGYLAALGAIGGLAPLVDAALSDALNHASLIDGLRATKLARTVYAHLGPVPAHGGAALLVSETIFGMDGDAVDVAGALAALGPDDVALLDEAHALGVAGRSGGGLAREFADPRIVVVGTLSKAFGALGGFVAGPASVVELLRNTARTFVFDTALPPAVAAAAQAALAVSVSPEGDRRRADLADNLRRLRAGLQRLGHPGGGTGAVVPIVVGSPEGAVAVSAALAERGLRVPAIRPPTVPPGTSRLRVSLRADHTAAEVDALLCALEAVLAPVLR